MYIKSEYPFRWRYEYVPTYYEGLTEEQRKIQRTVLDFKNGDYDDGIMEWFRRQIYKIVKGEKYAWVICFLPCTNDVRKHSRFQKLAAYLTMHTRVPVFLDTIGFIDEDRGPSHIEGKRAISETEIALHLPDIFVKNVILIDDIITTGRLFNATAKAAELAGANNIRGLFLAKAIQPALPQKPKKTHDEWYLEEWC